MKVLFIFPDLLDYERQGESSLIDTAYRSSELMQQVTDRSEHRFGPTELHLDMLTFLLKSTTKSAPIDGVLVEDYVTLVSDIATTVKISVTADRFAMFDAIVYVSLGAFDQYRTLCPSCLGEGCSKCTEQYTVKETIRHIRKSEVNATPIAIIELDLLNRDRWVEQAAEQLAQWFYAR